MGHVVDYQDAASDCYHCYLGHARRSGRHARRLLFRTAAIKKSPDAFQAGDKALERPEKDFSIFLDYAETELLQRTNVLRLFILKALILLLQLIEFGRETYLLLV